MKESYIARRSKLIENKQGPCMICIFSGNAPRKSLDSVYPFYVDRNFFYLTGIDHENMILMLRKDQNGDVTESLFIEPYDEELAKWVGGRMRSAEATENSGVTAVFDIGSFDDHLNGLISRSRGLDNKALAKFSDQVNQLCNQWEKKQ